MFNSIHELIDKGGIIMYPLFFCSIIAAAIVIERSWVFFQKKGGLREKFPLLEKLINSGNYTEGLRLMDSDRNPVSQVICLGLREKDKPIVEIEENMALKAGEEIFALKKNLNALGVIATISTMLGLLGTVTGLVKAFQSVADLERMVSPRILAIGIWEALLTTVVGLFISIPAWVFYHFFRSSIEKTSFQIEHYAGKLILMLKFGRKNEKTV